MVSLADTEATLAAFTDALVASVERRRGEPRPVAGAGVYAVDPVTVLPPREAFFAAAETVPTAEAVGRVSAELVAPYPPGIPVLAPGEEITEGALDALRAGACGRRPDRLRRRSHAGDPARRPVRC